MFNFKDQQIKIIQKQNQYNQVKNLRKEISRQSPFKYASKKISFNVKNRSEFWDKLEQSYLNDKDKIDFLIINEIKNILTNDSNVNYQTEALDSVMYTPVSPVLAITLIMLNKALFKCDTFDKYINNTENQVYAYTHWTGDNFLNKNSLVIDDPFGNETDKYMQILPGYNNIEVMKFYKGYQLYMTSYDTATNINNTTAATHTEPKFWGSYNIDTKRFQRIFNIQPSLGDSNTGTVGNISDLKGTDGTTETDIETLNKHPELDSYLYADGIFKRLMDSPYNSQSYQISVIRGGYGFGPINIACFLRAKEFNIERITDIISGILISEDSGMPLVDALKGIQEWRNVNTGSDIDIMFNSLSDIRILRYLEYIGSIFFTAILGSSLKEKPLLNLPLTNNERKTYDVGYLMGHNYDVFVQMFKNGIKNKIWLKESTEIFSFEVPCVLYGTTPTSGIFKIGDYVKNYADSLLLGSEPLDYAFNISSILDKEKALTDYIIPQKGYTIFDFVTKGLNNCLITEVLKNIDKGDLNELVLASYQNSVYSTISAAFHSNIQLFMSPDFLIAPRVNYNSVETTVDENLVLCKNDVQRSSLKFNSQYENGITKINRFVLYGNKIISFRFGLYDFNNDRKDDIVTPFISFTATFEYNSDGSYTIQLKIFGDSNERKYFYDTQKNRYELLNNSNDNLITLSNLYLVIGKTSENISSVGYSNVDFSNVYVYYSSTRDYKKLSDVIIEKLKDNSTESSFNILREKDNKIYKMSLVGSINGVTLMNNGGECLTRDEIIESYCFNTVFNSQGRVIQSLKYDSFLNYMLQCNIKMIFELCGFTFLGDNTHTMDSERDVKLSKNLQRYYQATNFINRFGLCILKLSTINAFCTSYSLDLLSLPDTTRQFYDIYKSYLSDFIDIKQDIQN